MLFAGHYPRLQERIDAAAVAALDVEEEIRIFCDVCNALSDFLEARQAA
jgi:hypothetical protein